MMETILLDLQQDVVARLRADELFVDIPVMWERKADIVQEVKSSLGALTGRGGKSGACAIIMSPVASDNLPEITFGPLEVDVTILILEDVITNSSAVGTGKAALTIARRVRDVFKHYTPGGLASPFIPNPQVIVPVSNPLAAVAYEVRFKTREADSAINLRVSTPAISPSSGAAPQTVTLTSATSYAAIYYTLDGSHPWSGNATAVLYTAPISIATPKTLRACAFKTGSIASNVNRADYT